MRWRLPVFAAVIAIAAGCGGGEEGTPEGGVKGAVAEQRRVCAPGSVAPMRTPRRAYAAIVRTPVRVFRRPGAGPFARFGRLNANAVPTVFGVLSEVRGRDCAARWYHVQLPRKPNGVTGFVRARDVELFRVATRIDVDLSERRVVLYRNGRKVLEAVAAIGSTATPTPVGSYYVNQRLIPYDTAGPFGPGAIGISAFSDVLTGWTQGGPIAIHGTNQPWSIGKAVSNGCIRVPNPVLRRLFGAALPGTPVVIRV